MFKKLYIYLALLLTFVGCRDEFDLPVPAGMDSDGNVEFNLALPSLKTVSTRAVNEDEVKEVTVLVFDGDNKDAKLKAIISPSKVNLKEASGSNYDYTVSFKITDRSLISEANSLQFYFLANYTSTSEGLEGTNLERLSTFYVPLTTDDGYMVMSGKADLSTSVVELYRNGAKISVTDPLPQDDNGSLADLEKSYPFQPFGMAAGASILAGVNHNMGTSMPTNDYPESLGNELVYYVNPTKNDPNQNNHPFVIVKANWEAGDGKDYYYRLDFKKETTNAEGKKTESLLDVEANHWYQFLIQGVTGPGAATPEAAAANPTPLIEYTIHDHVPVIYNMVSDGIRELGVSNDIVYSGDISKEGDTDEAKATRAKLYIKLYSLNGDEEYALNEQGLPAGLKIEGEEQWFEIKNLKPSDYAFDREGDNKDSDKDKGKDEGKVFEAEIYFRKPNDFGDLQGELTISWMGLSRKVKIDWDRMFDTSDLINATLYIYNETDECKETVSDYFAFLASENDNNYTGKKLFGVSAASNNQKVRDEGFHFPVMYGHRAQKHKSYNDYRWHYEYKIDLKDANELKGTKFDWSLEVSGSETIAKYVTVNGNEVKDAGTHEANASWSFTLNRLGNALDVDGSSMSGAPNDYTYGTGELKLTITPYRDGDVDGKPTGAPQVYTFDLYHTGFFHLNKDQNHRVDVTDPDNHYYYYEVVPIMGASRMRYWLDRNLGAKSAGLYIQATGGVTYYGDENAAGGYYQVAEYTALGAPKMYDKNTVQSERVSPPGYRVPMQKVWNALRNSTNFDTQAIGGYFNSCYHTSVGDVFFPKARYKDIDGNDVGESRAGYYWTSTVASGVEKEETGKWLKVLSISGETTSYINGAVNSLNSGYNVNGNTGDAGYAMSVRPINDIEDASNPYRTSLVVSGATHVYLYRIDNEGNRIATTTWPGHVIGNALTMNNPDNWFEFSYESDNIPAEEFYVIFNFVDEKGKIYTMGKRYMQANGSWKEPMDYSASTVTSPSKIEGWKIIGDNYFASKYESGLSSIVGNPTNNEYYWRCYHDKDNYNTYCYYEKPEKNNANNLKISRLYWKYSDSYAGFNVFGPDKRSYADGVWADLSATPPSGTTFYETTNKYADWRFSKFNDEYVFIEISTEEDLRYISGLCAESRKKDGTYDTKYYLNSGNWTTVTENGKTISCTIFDNGSWRAEVPNGNSSYLYRIYWAYDSNNRNAIKVKLNNTWYPSADRAYSYEEYIQNPAVFPSGVKYGVYSDNAAYYYLEIPSSSILNGMLEYEVWGSNTLQKAGSMAVGNMYQISNVFSAVIYSNNSIAGGSPIVVDPIEEGYYRIYWKADRPKANPDNTDEEVIKLNYIYFYCGSDTYANPDGGNYVTGTYAGKVSRVNSGYRYFDFKPTKPDFTPLCILRPSGGDDWSNQTEDINLRNSWFDDDRMCTLSVVFIDGKYVVNYLPTSPKLAPPRRKARSINQVKKGR